MANTSHGMLPIVRKILRIRPLNFTGTSVKVNFSSHRRLKPWIRSKMSEKRLNGLAQLHCNRNVNINFDDVTDELAKSNRRNDFALRIMFSENI